MITGGAPQSSTVPMTLAQGWLTFLHGHHSQAWACNPYRLGFRQYRDWPNARQCRDSAPHGPKIHREGKLNERLIHLMINVCTAPLNERCSKPLCPYNSGRNYKLLSTSQMFSWLRKLPSFTSILPNIHRPHYSNHSRHHYHQLPPLWNDH